MAVEKIISTDPYQQGWRGLIADTKPGPEDGVVDFAVFIEEDSGILYRFLGGHWFVENMAGARANIDYSDSQILTGRAYGLAKYLPTITVLGVSETLFSTDPTTVVQAAFVDVDVINGDALLEMYEVDSVTDAGVVLKSNNLDLTSSDVAKTIVTADPTGVVLNDPNNTIDGGLVSTGKSAGGSKYGDLSFIINQEAKLILMRLTNIGQSDISAFIRYRWYEEVELGTSRGYTPTP